MTGGRVLVVDDAAVNRLLCEERLQQQVTQLRIEIDRSREEKQVAEITETDYFRSLRDRAADLRRTAGMKPDPETG